MSILKVRICDVEHTLGGETTSSLLRTSKKRGGEGGSGLLNAN